jgi:hypothetical protein
MYNCQYFLLHIQILQTSLKNMQTIFSNRLNASRNSSSKIRFHTGMGSNKILASLYDLVPTLSGFYRTTILLLVFGPYILNLPVSSCLESIKLQMLIKMKTSYYHGHLANSSLWSALMPEALSSPPFSRK